MPHPGLDNDRRFEVTNQAPDRTDELGITVIPAKIAFRAEPVTASRNLLADPRPKLVKFARCFTRKRNAETVVKPVFPFRFGSVPVLRS